MDACATGSSANSGAFPLIENCTVDTGSRWEDLAAFPTTYINGIGIYFKDCYYGMCIEPRVSGRWRHGIRFEGNMYRTGSVHADFEGAIVSGGEVVGWPEIGISINHLARLEDEPSMSFKEPGFFLSRTHVHAHLAGIRAHHHSLISILDCNIVTTDGQVASGARRQNECHIDLHDVHSVIIDHCHFWGQGYDNGDTDCTRGIVINDKVNHVSINGNHFMHRGIGVLVGNADAMNIMVGPTNVWGGRAVGSNVYQVIQPRIRVQKRPDGADVVIPRMHDAAVYDGQVCAKTFDRGPGYWTQALGWAEIVTTVPGGMDPRFTHALQLNASGCESRWVPDQLPNGATLRVTAVLRNAQNPYAVNLGVQVRNAAGTIVSKVQSAATAGQAGWVTASVEVQATAFECGAGWRPLIQMAGIGSNTNANCQVAYFDIEWVRRMVSA